MTIGDQIKKLAKQAFKGERIYSEVCTVVSVSGRLAVCQPIDDSAKLQKVRLQAIGGQSVGFVLVPKVGSYVIVTFIDKVNGFISSTTELKEIFIDTDLVTFNGGSNDGLVNVNDLVTKLNNLENTLNTFMNTTYNTHTHISAAPGSPTAVPVPLNTTTLTPTVKADLEDTKITH